MEELEKPEPDYIKGFNEGYLLAEHMPELAAKLAPVLTETSRSQGIKDGFDQYALEKDLTKQQELPEWRRRDWLERLDKKKDPDVNKDVDEPSR